MQALKTKTNDQSSGFELKESLLQRIFTTKNLYYRIGFGTCFGWDPSPKELGSDSKYTSQIRMLLASHFEQ